METLDFILKRYGLKLNEDNSPIKIPYGRWREMSSLFGDLGFKKGVEVGVYRGRFTNALCLKNPGLELIGVDAWTVYNGYKDYPINDLEKEAFEEAERRNAKFNVRFIKAFSMDAVKEFADESLDFVYIDANHNFEYVVEDIAAWSKKVRKGGIVCGHDYIKNEEFKFGVLDAVNGWCSAYNIKPLFLWGGQTPSWMYIKK